MDKGVLAAQLLVKAAESFRAAAVQVGGDVTGGVPGSSADPPLPWHLAGPAALPAPNRPVLLPNASRLAATQAAIAAADAEAEEALRVARKSKKDKKDKKADKEKKRKHDRDCPSERISVSPCSPRSRRRSRGGERSRSRPVEPRSASPLRGRSGSAREVSGRSRSPRRSPRPSPAASPAEARFGALDARALSKEDPDEAWWRIYLQEYPDEHWEELKRSQKASRRRRCIKILSEICAPFQPPLPPPNGAPPAAGGGGGHRPRL